MSNSDPKQDDIEYKIDSKKIFSGQIIDVQVDQVALPNGKRATREIVAHAQAVVIVPIDAQGNLIMVSQYRYAVNSRMLEFPAGGLDEGESPEDCAQRELREETGFASEKLINLGGFWSAPGFLTEYLNAFLALDLYDSNLEPDPDELITTCSFSFSKVKCMVNSGEIQDSKTIAALYMAINSSDFPLT
ncbi:MAG: ADP-ribose pyrophosphatase [Dehalococcoidia bacterium]|nr:ADP-ribose pyrophosphatase [Dehalococcoidia bacterium]MQG15796.1 NUDIX hydrolase [SAR202 cluster bacterium]|tara:strand:- start:14230 stop:14796 length:567 start_codon:yes stop_codon:yes gene_type:complete